MDTLLSSPACVTVASPASGTDPWQLLHTQALSATNTPSRAAGKSSPESQGTSRILLPRKSREVSQTTLCFPGATLSHASEMGTPGPGQMAPLALLPHPPPHLPFSGALSQPGLYKTLLLGLQDPGVTSSEEPSQISGLAFT